MGTIDSALFSRLGGFAGLNALVSTRIYPPPAPQNAIYPLVTCQEDSLATAGFLDMSLAGQDAEFLGNLYADDIQLARFPVFSGFILGELPDI